MKKNFKLMAAAVVLSFGFSVGSANAGIFDGQTVNYQYFFPDSSSPYSGAANGNYFVDSSVEITNVVDGHGTLDLGGNGFVVHFDNDASFSSGAFNGFVISDVFSTINPFTSFTLVSNTGIAGDPTLSFDADHLYVNWQGLGFGGGDLVFEVSAVPEPETYAMLIAGLGILGFAARRRQQNA